MFRDIQVTHCVITNKSKPLQNVDYADVAIMLFPIINICTVLNYSTFDELLFLIYIEYFQPETMMIRTVHLLFGVTGDSLRNVNVFSVFRNILI